MNVETIKTKFDMVLTTAKEWLEPENLARLRPELRYQTGVLAVFALLAAILLGGADLATRDVIQLRLEEDLKVKLEEVVPAEIHDNDLLTDSITLPSTNANIGAAETVVYLAKKQGEVNACVLNSSRPMVTLEQLVW
jgi:electron transport complex protein RnfG